MKTKEEIITQMKKDYEASILASNLSCDKYCQSSKLEDLKEMNRNDRVSMFLKYFIMEVECSPEPVTTIRESLDYYQDKVINYCKYVIKASDEEFIMIQEEITKLTRIVDRLKSILRYARSE